MTATNTLNPKLRKAKRDGWSEWIRTEQDERAVANGCEFKIEKAERVREFFVTFLRQSKGIWAGKPLELMDWQWRHIIGPMFGWVRPDGTRRIRKVYVEVAKKNGKSTLGAGIGLYLLVGDGEPGAEIYSAATKKEQAAIVHDEAIRMARASVPLVRRLRVNLSSRVISDNSTNSKYAALAADAAGSEGANIHGLICDELHVWKDRAFWDSLLYGFIARRQPMLFIITTAGVFDKTTIGWQEHDYAIRFLAGDIDCQEYIAYVRAAGETDDPFSRETHAKANPAYGVIVDPDEIDKSAKDAKEKPSELFTFLRYRLNIWTEAASPWLDMGKWDACGGDPIDEEELRGRKCYGGLDIASRIDLAAFVLVFPPWDDGGQWHVLCRFWCPREGAEVRYKRDGVKYLIWAQDGHINLTPGNEVDHMAIVRQIEEDRRTFDLRSIGGDPWNLTTIRQLVDPEGEYIIEFGQNFQNFSAPTKKLDALVRDGKLRHGGHPILRWNVANVRILMDTNDNERPSKKHSSEKIDGATGMVMALGRAMVDEDDVNYYDEYGL